MPFDLPAHACDSHMHIYDRRYLGDRPANGLVEGATVHDYRKVQARIGTQRTVVVTPRLYETDNRVTLDAIAHLGIDHARGVAVLRPDVIMFIAGVILHGHPLAYADAVKNAAKQTGSMMLQYPLYGGIMGMMDATGLPDVISHFFIAISNAHTLPFWSYVCSLIVTFFIPSGGGHWAVQGPFVVPAAVALHASVPATTMAVAMGEQVSNMMQPFWAAPVVAMAGIGVQRVLGFTVMTFLLGTVVYGMALLLLV
ncbi:TIGR00366 family protein [Trinickia sp. EG282A]|uniref:TIGR00366 family protein n=1 Tax=Trinickia sp. EG282A TaxID=3237013 RepID=UPI0034D236C4